MCRRFFLPLDELGGLELENDGYIGDNDPDLDGDESHSCGEDTEFALFIAVLTLHFLGELCMDVIDEFMYFDETSYPEFIELSVGDIYDAREFFPEPRSLISELSVEESNFIG